MLNMIPLDIINNNSVLEEHILAKDIIAAMKWSGQDLGFYFFHYIFHYI